MKHFVNALSCMHAADAQGTQERDPEETSSCLPGVLDIDKKASTAQHAAAGDTKLV